MMVSRVLLERRSRSRLMSSSTGCGHPRPLSGRNSSTRVTTSPQLSCTQRGRSRSAAQRRPWTRLSSVHVQFRRWPYASSPSASMRPRRLSWRPASILLTSPDREYRLGLTSALVPRLSHAEPDDQAGRLAAFGAARGLERLRADNREIWNGLWKGRITVDGADDRWQRIIDASTFYLLSSVHAS